MKRRLLFTLPLLTGCAEWRYRAGAVGGHLDLLAQARPVDEWLDDPATPEATRTQLQRAQQLRRFAVEVLKLPNNASYQRYVELPTPAVVWNVVAAPQLSLQLKRWCFPVMGCVAYRGHWRPEAAEAEQQQLEREGWDVYRYGVPAYSTLGYSNWLGGDPLLSTFVRGSAADLARLLFHELAHQRVYAKDDSGFNESYATAVERLGLRAWWAARPDPAQQAADAQRERRRETWRQLSLAARSDLQQLYASAQADKPAAKAERLQALLRDTERLAQTDAGFSGYLPWARRANNASLALLSTYQLQVPAFEALFERLGGDWAAFHQEVARLAALPRTHRDRELP
ncbi:MAG: aminopeptidase [Burkholderiales bacterium]|nr:aminopeptidase [Burkholderiales bacterium]